MRRNVLVTGGAGFIGSAVVRRLIQESEHQVLVVDKLTYAGNLDSLAPVAADRRFRFVQADICDAERIARLFDAFEPDIVMNLAAESHVDRSIDGPADFLQTNVVGTVTLLQEALRYWRGLSSVRQRHFRFHHVSTDEVFGALGAVGRFHSRSPHRPNSPYSASKAASDHFVRAWHHTYGLPVVTTNCSNNYGPYHFPEKLIPLMIVNALEGRPLPVYGRGENVRDWLYVNDHAEALIRAAEHGRPGETYLIGGRSERRNVEVVEAICALMDEMAPPSARRPHARLITWVEDRPGHDLRYAVDPSRTERELGWCAREDFESGLAKTVRWYLDNRAWWQRVRAGIYRGERLGLTG